VTAVFLDTNLIAYQFDDRDLVKRDAARRIIPALPSRPWISTQVLIELHNVLVRYLGYTREEAQDVIESNSYHVQPADASLVYDAVATATRHQLRIYDAMILEAAVRAGCEELWTEDFPSGATLRGVRIVNPFEGD
jgi:predicted nucleic acid-binding protein